MKNKLPRDTNDPCINNTQTIWCVPESQQLSESYTVKIEVRSEGFRKSRYAVT